MTAKLSAVETLKTESHRLRGTLAAELAEGGIQVSEDAYQLLKFHGSYEQFDRDTATDRKQHGLEKEYQFMLRCRMPGGRMTTAQYLYFDRLADTRANGSIRITVRQGIQFHGILKGRPQAGHRRHQPHAADHHVRLRRRGAQHHGQPFAAS